jgi:hypothetical protein
MFWPFRRRGSRLTNPVQRRDLVPRLPRIRTRRRGKRRWF